MKISWGQPIIISEAATAASDGVATPLPGNIKAMGTWYPTRDNSIDKFAQGVYNAVSPSPSLYGISTGDATALNSALTAYATNLGVVDSTELAFRAAVAAKDASKAELIKKLQLINNKAQATPSVTDAQKREAGLPVRDTSPSKVTAQAVPELNASGFETGQNKLKWTRVGNPSNGVKFTVWVSYDSGVEWSQIKVTGATKFTHSGQTPGVTAWYKVIAFSVNNEAPASPVAIVYADGGSGQLSIAA